VSLVVRSCSDAADNCVSPDARALIVDCAPMVHLDSTGADTIGALTDALAARGITLAFGGVLPPIRRMLERSGALERLGADAVFPTLRAAVNAYEARPAPTSKP
jgi:sulfate permease, SulP family